MIPVKFSVLVVLSLLPSLLIADTLPVKYSGNNHWYQLITPNTPVTKTQAQNDANSKWLLDKQGYLVTITDVYEANFLNTMFFNTNMNTTAFPVSWTGARKTQMQWYWYALNRVSQAFWGFKPQTCIAGQFCNWAYTGGPEECQVAEFFTGSNTPGKWKPWDCDTGLASFYIVEYDAPSATAPCPKGYQQTQTPYPQCVDVDECALNSGYCSIGYTCTNTVGSAVCTDIDECAANPALC
jgi:hypothetical protein